MFTDGKVREETVTRVALDGDSCCYIFGRGWNVRKWAKEMENVRLCVVLKCL